MGEGTCRLHLCSDCTALLRWRPEMRQGQRLTEVVMRQWRARIEQVPHRSRCRIRWKARANAVGRAGPPEGG